MKQLRCICLFLGLTFSCSAIAQVDTVITPTITLQHDFVKLSGEVKIIDSQYILITKLTILNNEKIEVEKLRHFNQSDGSIAKNKLSLQRLVRGTLVNISVSKFSHPIYNEDWDKTLAVDKKHPLTDTINLGHHYPFEKGEYCIIAEIEYTLKTRKHVASSSLIPFVVSFLPKGGVYNE